MAPACGMLAPSGRTPEMLDTMTVALASSTPLSPSRPTTLPWTKRGRDGAAFTALPNFARPTRPEPLALWIPPSPPVAPPLLAPNASIPVNCCIALLLVLLPQPLRAIKSAKSVAREPPKASCVSAATVAQASASSCAACASSREAVDASAADEPLSLAVAVAAECPAQLPPAGASPPLPPLLPLPGPCSPPLGTFPKGPPSSAAACVSPGSLSRGCWLAPVLVLNAAASDERLSRSDSSRRRVDCASVRLPPAAAERTEMRR